MKEWHNPVMEFLRNWYRPAVQWAIEHRCVTVGAGAAAFCDRRCF